MGWNGPGVVVEGERRKQSLAFRSRFIWRIGGYLGVGGNQRWGEGGEREERASEGCFLRVVQESFVDLLWYVKIAS